MGVIARRGDELLLIRRGRGPGKGLWSVPGGKVEPGETLAEAAVRELAEETGLAGVCGAFVGWAERIGRSRHFVILDFEVTVTSAVDEEPAAGSDASEARWHAVAETAELRLVDGLADFLRDHGVIPADA